MPERLQEHRRADRAARDDDEAARRRAAARRPSCAPRRRGPGSTRVARAPVTVTAPASQASGT